MALNKITIKHHLRSKYDPRQTKCGLPIDSMSDIVNDDGYKVPANKNSHQFDPYLANPEFMCKKCKPVV